MTEERLVPANVALTASLRANFKETVYLPEKIKTFNVLKVTASNSNGLNIWQNFARLVKLENSDGLNVYCTGGNGYILFSTDEINVDFPRFKMNGPLQMANSHVSPLSISRCPGKKK